MTLKRWSRAGSSARNACTGPDCCVWGLGDQPVERLARLGVRGVLHFWGGCHDDEQYRRASTRLGAATCSASTSTTARRTPS
jgi:hypothetical protein